MIRLSVQYFIVVFSAGFILGSLRILFLVALLGERNAELAELPVMMLVCAVAARYLTRKHMVVLSLGRVSMAAVLALILLLSVEFTAVLAIRGLSLAEYIAGRDPVSGLAYLLGLIWYAAAPVVFYRHNIGSAD